jgi:DNA-binding winged helix-turn-helix (wHTH) protein
MKRSEEDGIFLTGQTDRTRIAEHRGMGEMAEKKTRFGQFELDFGRFQLLRAGEPVRLEGLPLRLLMYLIDHHGQLVTREQIADALWGKDVFVDVEMGINTAIRKVRMALEDDSAQPQYLQTVVGHGYRFVALFSPSEETSASTDIAKVSLEELGQAIMAAAGLHSEESKVPPKDPQKP